MNRFLLSISALVLFTGLANGQPTEAGILPSAPGNQTLLWEVSGGNLKKPSYFLGTMHVLCPDDAFLSPAVKQVLDTVDEVYFELDLDDMGQMISAMKHMIMLNDTTLADLMDAEDVEKLKSALTGKIPFPFLVLQRMKPMLISGMLSEKMLPCEAGSGTEMLIMEEAKKRKLNTRGLETPAYQFSLFDSIPYRLQAQSLLKALDSTSAENTRTVARMLEAYQRQDLTELALLTEAEDSGLEGYTDVLLYNRNRNWVEKFTAIAPETSCLYAVGAGHLPGEAGVLRLLEQKGYRLRPLLNVIQP